MGQIIINILFATFLYLLISLSFTIEYYTTKFFNLFHAIVISTGAYLFYFFSIQLEVNIYLGVILSIILSTLLGIASEWLIFKPLRKQSIKPFQLMIASLGLYIIFQNFISIIWGDTLLSIRQTDIEVGKQFIGGYITSIQIKTIGVSALLFILIQVFLKYTPAGKNIRAVSSNTPLSNIFGINANRVFIYSFLIGSLFASIVGILVAFETGLSPNMGFNLFLYGAVVMIIGGTGNLWGLLGGALLISAAQNLGAYYFDSKWMDAIAYIILTLFLIWKPLGFSGKRLKKVEI